VTEQHQQDLNDNPITDFNLNRGCFFSRNQRLPTLELIPPDDGIRVHVYIDPGYSFPINPPLAKQREKRIVYVYPKPFLQFPALET